MLHRRYKPTQKRLQLFSFVIFFKHFFGIELLVLSVNKENIRENVASAHKGQPCTEYF